MLDDRPYMRDPADSSNLLVTYKLMIANAAVFVLASVLAFHGGFRVNDYFALSVYGLERGYLWQFVTFQFLHGGLLHLLLNMVMLYFFGRALEQALGGRRMLHLYLASGCVGGLFQILLQLIAPRMFGAWVVGASAGVFGLVAAFATLFPHQRITFLLFFFIPVSMSARIMLWISFGLSVFGILVPHDNLADGAHLGGLLAGVYFVKTFVQGNGWSLPRLRFRSTPRVRIMPSPKAGSAPPPPADEPLDDDFIAREIDPILDKISARGIGSLTERERRILEAARSRMGRR